MSANTIDYKANLTGAPNLNRDATDAVFADCPWNDIVEAVKDGVQKFDDFTTMPLAGTQTTQIGVAPDYKVYCTSGTVQPVAPFGQATMTGHLGLPVPASTNSFAFGHAYAGFKMSGVKSDSGKLWFEARVALTTIGVNTNAFFLGLGEVEALTFGAAVPLTAAEACSAAGAMIGFYKPGNVATGVGNTVYADRAAAFTAIGTGEFTMAANTYTKLGIVYDPGATDPTQMVQFFQDGKLCPTKLTKAQLTALVNLPANRLGFLIASYGQANAASNPVYMDWYRIAQLNAGEGP